MPATVIKGVKVAFDEITPRSERLGTVVLLHSSGCSKAQWRALSGSLKTHYRVLSPDLHGYGKTGDWAGRRPLTLADEAEIVSAMTAGADGPIHLVGHSFGGAVALRFALERPEVLRSLTLIEPVTFHILRQRGRPEHDLLRNVRDLAASVAGDAATGMACFVDFWNGAGTWSRMPEESRTGLIRRAGKVAQDFHATIEEPVPAPAYMRIRVPTQILCGEASPAIAHAISGRLARLLPAAKLEVVPGAGHMLPLTHAKAVNAAVAAHLSETAEVAPLAA